MNIEDLTPGAFLYYPKIKKGIEIYSETGEKYVSIRDTSINNMFEQSMPLIITVQDEPGMMVLHNTPATRNLHFDSYDVPNKDYKTLKFIWTPMSIYSAILFNGTYSAIKMMKDTIKNHNLEL